MRSLVSLYIYVVGAKLTKMHQQDDLVIRTADKPLDDGVLGGLGHVYFKYMKKHSKRTAQIDAITGQADTYDSILQKCIRTSIALSKKGIVRGDVITYYSGVQINACVPVIASSFIGVLLSFLDTILPLTIISYLLKQVKPKLLLTDPENFEKIKNVIKNFGIDTEIVIFDDHFFKYQNEESSFKPVYVTNLEETAAIYFTSGSTGFPKAVCLNHYALLCVNIVEDILENMVHLSYDSFYWTIEALRLIALTRQGACRLISSQEFNATEIWNFIEKFKVNFIHLIPCDMIEMYKHGKPEGVNISSLMTLEAEGSRLPNKYLEGLQEMLPDTDIFQVYGMTEVGALAKFCKNKIHREYSKIKIGSVGLPIEGYGLSYRVVDLHSEENLGPNKSGELRVKSKTIMNGYYNLDSSDQFDKDGWFKTGDVVYYDEDYCFFVVDRIKHMLVYRGWHIEPAVIENELLNHPAVREAVVIGTPHEIDGEHPLAVVILNNNNLNDTTPVEIEKYINEKVPQECRPKIGVKFVNKFPLTATGKVKRPELKKMFLRGEI